MSVKLLIGKQQRQIRQLATALCDGQLKIERNKAELNQWARSTLASPVGLLLCFGAGCAAEIVWRKKLAGKRLPWGIIARNAFSFAQGMML